jgi:hypothetical protein
MMVVQELNQRDWVNRSDSCQAILQNVPANDVLSSDEAHFHLSGYVNKQNFLYWAHRSLGERIYGRPTRNVSTCILLATCLLDGLLNYSSTLKMEAIRSSETSGATQRTTRSHIPEDDTLENIVISDCEIKL